MTLDPPNENPKSWLSHISLCGGELPSKIGVLDSLGYGLALTLGFSPKASKAHSGSELNELLTLALAALLYSLCCVA